MPKSRYFLLPLLPTLALSASLEAVAADCGQLPPPSVTLRRVEVPITMNLNYSYGSLTNIGNEIAGRGNSVLGLTRGTAIVRFEIQIPSISDAARRYECASPQITINYGYNPMTIYVAREFPAGTCAYREIYDHEMRHVRTYQEHLARIEPELAAMLQQRFATGEPWRAPVGQTASQLQQELNSRWLPYITREIEKVKSAQAEIDTPEEYARVTASCNGEIKNRLNRGR